MHASPTASINQGRCNQCPPTLRTPKGVVAPWEARLGVAYYVSLDGQAFNPRSFYRNRSPAAATIRKQMRTGELDKSYLGGRYAMLSIDVVVIGPVDNAIGLTALARQAALRAGEDHALSFHVGTELEVLPRRFRIRIGSYLEPSRYDRRNMRLHGTLALFVRMFDFNVPLFGWRGISASVAFDFAERYSNLSTSFVSFWH